MKLKERGPAVDPLDTEFLPYGSPEENLTSMLFGPIFISSNAYNLCSPEDVSLANMLLRPGCVFLHDLSKKSAFSEERFGSVKRAFIVCPEDKAIPAEFQRWQVETIGVDQVKEIENADHMAMLSTPRQLSQCLLEIANYYV